MFPRHDGSLMGIKSSGGSREPPPFDIWNCGAKATGGVPGSPCLALACEVHGKDGERRREDGTSE